MGGGGGWGVVYWSVVLPMAVTGIMNGMFGGNIWNKDWAKRKRGETFNGEGDTNNEKDMNNRRGEVEEMQLSYNCVQYIILTQKRK